MRQYDPAAWSDAKTSGFIQMTPLSEKLLCVTATSAPVKRVFSHGRLFVRPHEARQWQDALWHDNAEM